jgi:hypothetical protein
MNRGFHRTIAAAIAAAVALGVGAARTAGAHCDTLDGPVVVDARAALAAGDVTPVLKWVQVGDEPEIRAAFDRTLAVRAAGGAALELADTWFFETLVRVHRAGEGAPYTGLKPAGAVEPGIAAADLAIDSGSVDSLVAALTEHLDEGVRNRFERVVGAREHAGHNVAAGRAYVAAYVDFIHYVEGLHVAMAGSGHGAATAGNDAHAH